MKGFIIAIVTRLLPLTFVCALAFEDAALSEQARSALSLLDKTALQELFSVLPEQTRVWLAPDGVDKLLWSFLTGEGALTLSGASSLLRSAFYGLVKFAACVLSLCVVGGVAAHMTSAFGRQSSEIAGFICYTLCLSYVTVMFTQSLSCASDAVFACSNGVNAAFPVLITLMTATGACASAGLLQSATAILAQSVSAVVCGVLFPLVLALGACGVIANISGSVPLKNLQKLFKSALKWALGLLSTVYLGSLTLRSIAARGADGLSLRAARFTLDKLVPYVGGIMSGSVDSLLGISVLVKNAFGICVMLLAAGALLLPVLRLGAVQLTFRLIAAIAEPIGDVRLASTLGELADALSCAAAVALVSLLMLTLTVGALLCCSSVII